MASNDTQNNSSSRKKGGLRGAFQDLVNKLIAYWEVMVIYIEKNLNIFIRNLVISSVWIFSSLFFIFIALLYFSYGIFLSLQKFITGGDPILSSFATGGVCLIIAVLLVEVVLKRK